MTDPRLVLLGDSILDNLPYTAPAPDTATHLRDVLGGWSVELLARDGATMADVPGQLRSLEGRPDVAVLSIGGNDALAHVGLLERRGTTSVAVFDELLSIADDFERRYEEVARAVAERAESVVLCTIYEVRLEPVEFARAARVPLAVLNDRIIRIGARLGADSSSSARCAPRTRTSCSRSSPPPRERRRSPAPSPGSSGAPRGWQPRGS